MWLPMDGAGRYVTRNPKKRISLGYRFFAKMIVRLKQKSPVRFRRLFLPIRLTPPFTQDLFHPELPHFEAEHLSA